MPRFAYVARTLNGGQIDGVLRAPDEQTLRNKLSLKGIEVLSVQAPAKAVGGKDARASGIFAPVKLKTLTATTGQLALMLRTGTSLVDSLEALAAQTAEYKMADILKRIAIEVSGGSTLAEALRQHPRVFDGFYVSAVQAGEASGKLTQVFERLESTLQKRAELRSSLITALIYPIIVSCLAIGAVIFIVTFVLPKFIGIFERGGVALPLPTRMLMAISGFIMSYWFILLPAAIALPMAFVFFAKTPRGKHLLDKVLLELPILGSVTQMLQTTALLRTLGTLLDSGVPLIETLSVARGACSNSRYRQLVDQVSAGVIRGESMASTFSVSGLITPAIRQMIRTGEETGTLATVLNAVSNHLDNETDKRMKRLSAIFEPLIIIVMGVVIGFIAVSVLLPLFKLSSAARGG